MFGFPFNGDTMILPEVQKWQDDEVELSRRMIKGRDHRPVVSTSDIPELTESVYEQISS